jgi:hypothetical protein
MARNTKKVALIKGRVIRVTRLDACGRPVYGDDNVVTSKGFISVALKATTNTTNEVLITNASGETIVREAAVTDLSGYSVEVTLAEVDPELLALVTNQNVVFDADGNASGFDIDTQLSLTGSGVALEVWAGAPATDSCDNVQSQGTYGYILLPFLQGGILGDFSILDGGISFILTGMNTTDGNHWGKGPFDVQLNPVNGGPSVPGPLLTSVGSTIALRVLLVDVAPPVPVTGSRPLLNPANTALTAVTPTHTAGSKSVAFAVSPTVAAGVGVWYDFGDDTWDYVLSPGTTTHVYPDFGTYTAKASTNGKWVSSSFTLA